MEKGRGLALAIVLCAVSILFPLGWPAMPSYIARIGVYFFGVMAVIIILSYLPSLFRKKTVSELSPLSSFPDKYYESILDIKGEEPSSRPSMLDNMTLVYLSITSFALLGAITTKIPIHFNLEWVLLFLVYAGLPSWLLVDMFIFERRQNRLGKSRVATPPRTIILSSDIQTVFNKCLKILDMMNTTRIIVERPRLIKAWQREKSRRGNVITVNLNRGRGKGTSTKIEIVSDSQWTTTRWDFRHVNRRNVDTFERLIISEIGQSEAIGLKER
jgi:hypothetical protein